MDSVDLLPHKEKEELILLPKEVEVSLLDKENKLQGLPSRMQVERIDGVTLLRFIKATKSQP